MVLLDSGSHDSRYPNPVAAHGHRRWLAVFTQHDRVHGSTVFLTQLKDMTHFDPARDSQGAAIIRTGITFNHIAQVGHFRFWAITPKIDPGQMPIIGICPHRHIRHPSDGAVGNNRTTKTDWTKRAGTGTECRPDRVGAGEGQRGFNLR